MSAPQREGGESGTADPSLLVVPGGVGTASPPAISAPAVLKRGGEVDLTFTVNNLSRSDQTGTFEVLANGFLAKRVDVSVPGSKTSIRSTKRTETVPVPDTPTATYTVVEPDGDQNKIARPTTVSGSALRVKEINIPRSYEPGSAVTLGVVVKNVTDTRRPVTASWPGLGEASAEVPPNSERSLSISRGVSGGVIEGPVTLTDESTGKRIRQPFTLPPTPTVDIADVVVDPPTQQNPAPQIRAVLANPRATPVTVTLALNPFEETLQQVSLQPNGRRTVPAGGFTIPDPPQPGSEVTYTVIAEVAQTGEQKTKDVTVSVPEPVPETSTPEPSDLALTRFQPPQVARPGRTLNIPFTVKNVGEEPIPNLQVGINNNFTPGVNLAPGDTFPSSVKVPLPTGEQSEVLTLVAESGGTELLSRSQSIALRPEEPKPPEPPKPPEEPDPPSFRVGNIDLPPNPVANKDFSIGLLIENVGGSKGKVRVKSPDTTETFTISPGGSRTFREEQVVVDNPGQFTREYTVTNLATGESFTREVSGTAAEQPSLISTGPEVLFGSTRWPVGNESFASRVRLEVTSAKSDGETATIKGDLINQPTRGGGFNVPVEVEAAVAGEMVTTEVTASPGFGGGPNKTPVSLTVDAVAPTARVGFHPTTVDSPSAIRDEVRGGVAEGEVPVQPPPPPVFDASLSVPEVTDLGATFESVIEVANTGKSAGDAKVNGPGISETVTVAPGESQTLRGQVTNDDPQGKRLTYTLTNVETGDTQQLAASVGTALPIPTLAAVDAPSAVPVGDQYDVTATVKNSGSAPGDVDVTVGQVTETVTVPPGETASVTATRTLTSRSGDRVPVRVTSPFRGEVGMQTVQVAAAVPVFEIDAFDVETTAQGVRGDVTVRNAGGREGVAEVTAEGRSDTVRVAPGETKTVTLQLPPPTAPVATYQASVAEADTGKTQDTETERVEVAKPELTIRRVDTPETAPAGTQYRVGVRVANDGDAPADVTVSVGRQQQRVSLSPGGEATVRFQREQPPAGTQRLQVTARAEGFPARSQRQVSISTPEQEQPQQPQEPAPEPTPEPSPPDREPPEQPAQSPFEQVLDALFPWVE